MLAKIRGNFQCVWIRKKKWFTWFWCIHSSPNTAASGSGCPSSSQQSHSSWTPASSPPTLSGEHALIKKKENFPHIYGNSEWSSGTVIYEEGLPNIWGMRKYFPIYVEAVSQIWLCNCSILNFLIPHEVNLIFILYIYQCGSLTRGYIIYRRQCVNQIKY